ncbi:Uncharacterised protein g11074 [Pycnogonum litorale]
MDSFRKSKSEEDEAEELSKRFVQEGISPFISPEQKLIHVFRWLTAAEKNHNKDLADRLEKVRINHVEEVEELEMTIKDLTIEIRRLNAELEDQDVKNAEIVSEEITQMLIKQGLKDLCSCGVSEQFAFLLVERAQMKEELEAECEKRRRRDHTHKLASKLNLTDNLKMSSPQIQQILDQQKDEFEEEFKHQQLMVKRLKEELRRVHETEMEKIVNEKESLKCQVSSANAKIEELVRLLSKGDVGGEDKTASWIYNILVNIFAIKRVD